MSAAEQNKKIEDVLNFIRYLLLGILDKPLGVKIEAKRLSMDGKKVLAIHVICKHSKDVGVLLGKKEHAIRMKDALVKICTQKAFYAGINRVDLTVSDESQ